MDEFVQILHETERGEARATPAVTGSLIRRVAELAGSAHPNPAAGSQRLTMRQCEIVALVEQGLMNKEIARRLGLSLSTVKNHVHNVLKELDLSSRDELALWYRSVRASSLNHGGLDGPVGSDGSGSDTIGSAPPGCRRVGVRCWCPNTGRSSKGSAVWRHMSRGNGNVDEIDTAFPVAVCPLRVDRVSPSEIGTVRTVSPWCIGRLDVPRPILPGRRPSPERAGGAGTR